MNKEKNYFDKHDGELMPRELMERAANPALAFLCETSH